jgi:predicted metal-dependent HD superfamily phosphohydrolase
MTISTTPSDSAFIARWQQLWQSMALPPPNVNPLLTRYAEPHRHYHNAAHILDCLDQLALAQPTPAPDTPLLQLAIFYHDAIYDPRDSHNESNSATLATKDLTPLLPTDAVATVAHLIQITDHHTPPSTDADLLLLDIDLSILGRDPATFDAYDAAIRQEYAHVPDPAYRTGRARLLQSFLARPRLYHTPYFFDHHEALARANLTRIIAKLTTP